MNQEEVSGLTSEFEHEIVKKFCLKFIFQNHYLHPWSTRQWKVLPCQSNITV